MAQSLNVSSLVSKPVNLVSAGDNQVAICEPIVYLQATVIGDLSQHYTEWEQISGVPVVSLINVDAVSSYYTVPGLPGTDKVFRFWVDRGTVFARYKDVIVYTTPSTEARAFEVGETWNAYDHPSIAKINTNRIYFTNAFDYSTPDASFGGLVTTALTLAIPFPEYRYQTQDAETAMYSGRFAGVLTQEWNGTTWVDGTQYGPSGPFELSVSLPIRMQFGALYNYPGRGLVPVYGQWMDFSGGVLVGNHAVPQLEVGELWNDVTLSRVIYILTTVDQTANIDQMEIGEVWNNVTFSRIVYVLESQTQDVTLSQMEVGELTNTFTVTRVAGGNLGG